MRRYFGRWRTIAMATVLLAALVPSFAAAAGEDAHADRQTLVGKVEIAEEGPTGKPQRLALVAGDARYLLAVDAKTEELHEFIGHKVRVVGSLSSGEKGEKLLTVRSFDVLEG